MKKKCIVCILMLLFIAAFLAAIPLLIKRGVNVPPIQKAELSLEASELLSSLPADPMNFSGKDIARLLKLDVSSRKKILKIYQDNPTLIVKRLKARLAPDASVKIDPKFKDLSQRCLEILETIPERRIATALRIEKAYQDLRDWKKMSAEIDKEIQEIIESYPTLGALPPFE
jgi:hypothetical protein